MPSGSAMTIYSDFRPYHFDAEHSNCPVPMMAVKGHHTRSLQALNLGSKPREQLINFDLNVVRGRSHSPRSAEQRTKHEALQNCFHPRAGYGADLDVMGGKRLVSPLSDITARRIDDYSPRGWSPQYHDIDHQASKRMFSDPHPSATPRSPRSETVSDVHITTLADAIGRVGTKATLKEQAHQRNLRQVWRRSTSPKQAAEVPASPRTPAATSPVQRRRSVSVRRRSSAHSPPRGQGALSPSSVTRLRSTPPQMLTETAVFPSPLLGTRSGDRLTLNVNDDIRSEISVGDVAAERGFELSTLGQNVKLLRALQNQASTASPRSTYSRRGLRAGDVKEQQKREAMEAQMSKELSKMQETPQETEFRRTLEKVLNEQLEATWSVISAKLDISGNRTPAAGVTLTHRDMKYGPSLTPTTVTTQAQTPRSEPMPQVVPKSGTFTEVPAQEPAEDSLFMEAPLKVGEEGCTTSAEGILEDSYMNGAMERATAARQLYAGKAVSPRSTIGTPSTTCTTCESGPRVLHTRSWSSDSLTTMQTVTPTGAAIHNANFHYVHSPVQQPRSSVAQRQMTARRGPAVPAKSWTSRRAWK